MTVNREHMQLWIDALRSGQYEQGSGGLRASCPCLGHHEFLYCCLGVACEVALSAGVTMPRVEPPTASSLTAYGEDCVTGLLPREVQDWLGLAANDPGLTSDVTCVRANDELDWSFNEIAGALTREYLR